MAPQYVATPHATNGVDELVDQFVARRGYALSERGWSPSCASATRSDSDSERRVLCVAARVRRRAFDSRASDPETTPGLRNACDRNGAIDLILRRHAVGDPYARYPSRSHNRLVPCACQRGRGHVELEPGHDESPGVGDARPLARPLAQRARTAATILLASLGRAADPTLILSLRWSRTFVIEALS
jgi:hypothetical protein